LVIIVFALSAANPVQPAHSFTDEIDLLLERDVSRRDGSPAFSALSNMSHTKGNRMSTFAFGVENPKSSSATG
jgi:hypothetical protein